MSRFAILLIGLTAATAAAQSAPPFISRHGGTTLCAALAPSDFATVGVTVTGLRDVSLDGPDSAYCVYATPIGHVELDLFFPAGADARDIRATLDTVRQESGRRDRRVVVAGAEDAYVDLTPRDLHDGAVLAVRRGAAVFAITLPRDAKAEAQLIELAARVVSRLQR